MSDENTPHPSALLISADLFFTSKITGTAAALGFQVEVQAGIPEVISGAEEGGYRLVIIDLANNAISPADVMARLPEEGRPRVIAFGPHVAKARLQAAEDAGCDAVMPRSRFSANLAEILRSALES